MSTSNDIMQQAAQLISQAISFSFPESYLDFVFGGMLKIDDVVEMVMIEVIREVLDETSKKKSLRQYLDGIGVKNNDLGYVSRYSRIMTYIMKYRQREYDFRSGIHEITPKMEQLLPPDMNDMKNKREGYQINDMQFFEINTIMGNKFTKSIAEHRLVKSKKVPNEEFKSIIEEYDAVIDDLNEDWESNSHKTVFNTMAAFTLEWKFPVHFIYSVAKRMDELGVSKFPDEQERLCSFCTEITRKSVRGNTYSAMCRMLTVRERYVDLMLTEPSGSDAFITEQGNYWEGLNIVLQMLGKESVMEGKTIKEWFLKNTTEADWATFCLDYDIFGTINDEKKEWNSKRIMHFRKLYDMILI